MPRRPWPAAPRPRVLEHPELRDERHPEEFGTERVERIDFYQRTGVSVLGFTVRRQIIARAHWITTTADRMQSCWSPLVSWGATRTLPALLGAFEVHVVDAPTRAGALP